MGETVASVQDFFRSTRLKPLRVFCVFYAVGLVLHAVPAFDFLLPVLTPLVLLGLAIYMFVAAFETMAIDRRFLAWLSVAFLVTFAVEAVGVHSGLVFGRYRYGHGLGPALLGVPLIIGVNWVVIAFALSQYWIHKTGNSFVSAVLTALGCVVFDLALEPVAVHLGYWEWAGGEIPLRNYVAWGVLGLLLSFSYTPFRVRLRTEIPLQYVAVQFCYFVLLGGLYALR